MTKRKKSTKKNKKEVEQNIRKLFQNSADQKYTTNEVSSILKIFDKNLKKLVLSILNDLKKEGFLHELQRGTFILNDNYKNTFVGTVDATSKGAAYIIVDGLDEDIYVRPEYVQNALNGDIVEVEIRRKTKNRIEGAVVRIIERKTLQFVGTLEVKPKFAFLIIDNPKINMDLYIPKEKLRGAKTGQKVLGKITSWPKGVENPFGEIIEILGEPGNNDTEMMSILLKNEFNIKFPEAVEKEVKKIGIELNPDEIKKRKDLRNKLTFTIDPFNAKDFDDALSYEKLENGNIEVGIHIADVSYYVQPETALDEEAFNRGNSVYLEDRVIPMLPEVLSNEVCSLRPDEDKYAFSAVFELNKNGKVIKEWFGKTVICSNKRFTYEDAQKIIEGETHEYAEAILGLDKIAKKLREKRFKDGALNIESEEIKFIIDDDGNPIGVATKIAKDANKLIEEFMLLTNRRIALFLGKTDKGATNQFIYRCHDKPAIEKLNTFSVFIDKFGYDIQFENLDSVAQKINAFLDKIKNTPEYDLIQSMAIRSMSKAEYQTNNIGHYGLAFDYYTHFTSPIRRYADLVVHRILLDKLENKKVNYGNKLNEISKHVSAQERKAIEAERESNKFFQVKFLKEKIGEEFKGTISGLTDFGMFVRINENYCEGMVPINDLPDDNYYFDNEKFQIIGRNTKFKYNFGDQVKIKVESVDLLKKQINFTMI